MLRYLENIEEWLEPQKYLHTLAVDVTARSLKVREVVQGYHHRQSREFPGMQPVSMNANNIQQLLSPRHSYVVAFKADGIRVFLTLLPNDNSVYLTGRDMKTHRLRSMNRRGCLPACERSQLYQLDGELVCYRQRANKELEFVFIPHDVLTYRGQCVEPLSFRHRLTCLDALVTAEDSVLPTSHVPFRVAKKSFLSLSYLQSLGQEKHQGLPSDGFIFQCMESPYRRGACDILLKWKPSQFNSVDFRVHVQATPQPGLYHLRYLCCGGEEAHSELVRVSSKQAENNCLAKHGKIFEFIRHAGKWLPIRARNDKLQPNSFSTYQKIVQSIQDGVSWSELLSVVQRALS